MERDLVELACREDWDRFISKLNVILSTEGCSLRGLCEPEKDMHKFSDHSSILHVICSVASVPLHVVETALKEEPELAVSLDGDGQTPLHVAVNSACPASIVRYLVRSAPQMALETDYASLRPIDILCRKIIMAEELSKYASKTTDNDDRSIKFELQRKILWACVQALAVAMGPPPPPTTTTTTTGDTTTATNDDKFNGDQQRDWEAPTLHCCLRAAPNDFPYFLLERSMTLPQFATDYETGDGHGNLPLHIVAAQSPPEEEDGDEFLMDSRIRRRANWLVTIARKYPLAAKTRNHDGKLPLDLAIQNHQRGWHTGVADLLAFYPTLDQFSIPLCTKILGLAATTLNRTTLLFELLKSRPELFSYHRNR